MFKLLRLAHRIIGLFGAVLILFYAITGLLLNHRSLIGYSSSLDIRLQKDIFSFHSGTIGNNNFVWLADFAAVSMIVLSITGLWMLVPIALKRRLFYIQKRRGISK